MRTTKLFASISALALMTAGAAYAQTATPPEAGSAQAADESTVTEVVVTGSRIARRDYVSASPIVTMGQDALAKSPSINVEASLNQLPQFAQGQNQSAIGAVNGGGRATLNLRGLGETRNLILLDGRRLPLSSAFRYAAMAAGPARPAATTGQWATRPRITTGRCCGTMSRT